MFRGLFKWMNLIRVAIISFTHQIAPLGPGRAPINPGRVPISAAGQLYGIGFIVKGTLYNG